jgi:glutathione peroxidase
MLLEIDGVRILTDPVFGLRASPVSFAGPKRFHPPPVTIEQLPALDAVLLSHDHYEPRDRCAWPQAKTAPTNESKETRMSVHDFSVTKINGQTQSLADYRGQVALLVNTASACGFTPQYAGLEELWRAYRDQGLVVLGFPSNDFGAQEPGSETEIQSFCSRNYDVSFPLFAKLKAKGGSAQAPLYAYLSAKSGAPQWNFHKYLVGKDGQVIAGFPSRVAPDDPKLRAAIEAALATPDGDAHA